MASNEKIQPSSHFFTQQNLITAQTAAQSFGPQSATVFNISSKFSVSAISKAFAICKSVVLVQPQTGTTDKVNLILKPFIQPIQGVNIKYFVYRGLRKSDFFTGNNVNILSETSSDFITKIRTDFTSFYEDAQGGEPTFLAKYIGFDTTTSQPDNLLLDEFFNKESQYVESNGEFVEDPIGFGNFELPIIDAGASLGNFSAGECAIDVVLDWGDYKPKVESGDFIFDLEYARAAHKNITLSAENTYDDSLKKEQIYQFLDITAYFGYHTANGTVTANNNGVGQKLTGVEIYDTVLTNFVSKNRFYLYIQSDRTRSYNFYHNYLIGETTNSLRYGSSLESLTDREYGTNGWPIIIESPSTDRIYLQFVTDNNINTVLYGQVADIQNATKNNFTNAEDLLLQPNENGELSNFTKVVEIANPVVDATLGIVGTFNILLYNGIAYSYEKEEIVNNEPVTFFVEADFIDDVFDLTHFTSIMTGSDMMNYTVVSYKKLKLINEYFDKKQQGISVVQTLMVKDSIETGDEDNPYLKRVAYITETVDVLNNSVSLQNNTSSSTLSISSSSGNVSPSKTYILPRPYFYLLQNFTDVNEIRGVTLNILDSTKPNKIIVGLSETENDIIMNITTINNLKNARLILIDFFNVKNKLESPESVMYQKYRLGVVGESDSSTNKLYYPEENIIIYSLDNRFFFTKRYSDYIKVQQNRESLTTYTRE